MGDYDTPATLIARQAVEYGVQLRRESIRTSRRERMVDRSLERPLARTGFLEHLAYCSQIIGCRNDGKEEKQQTGKRKGSLGRPETRLSEPAANR